MTFKAFISYSHAADFRFAEALHTALQRFAAPRIGLRIFRDTSNLSASPQLWPSIERALDESEFFLLIASAAAANSKWVSQEIQHRRNRCGADRLILVLASGDAIWDDQHGDFDFDRSTALPRSLIGAFSVEPLYVDFRGITPRRYDLGYPTFCDRIATIAATLHGVSKDVLFGLQVSSQIAARAARIAAQAELALRDGYPERSLLLARTALKLTEDRGDPRLPAAESVLRSALGRCGGRPLTRKVATGREPPVAFDPTGRWLAAIGTDGRAYIYDLQKPGLDTEPVTLPVDGRVVRADFTRDGLWLVTQSIPLDLQQRDKVTIKVWDVRNGLAFKCALGPADIPARCASLSVEATHLAAAFADGTIRIWNLADPNKDQPIIVLEEAGAVLDVALSVAEKRLVTLRQGRPQIWKLDLDKPIGRTVELDPPDARIFHVDLSPDGKFLLCSGDQSFLILLGDDPPFPAPYTVLTAYGGCIWKHDFSPDSLWLVTATGPPTYEELLQASEPEYVVRLWDLQRLKSWELIGHDDIVCDVAITPDGNSILSASFDRTIRQWSFRKLRQFQQVRIAERGTGHTSLSRSMPGGLEEHEAHVAQEEFGQHMVLLGGDHGLFHCIPSPDGNWLFSSGNDPQSIDRLWHSRGLSLTASPIHLPKQLMPAQMASISPTQKWFFFSVLARAAGCETEFSANHRWFRFGDRDQFRLFDVVEDSERPAFTIDARGITSPRLSPDGRWFAALKDRSLLIWELGLGKSIASPRRISGDSGKIDAATFSKCGRWLITLAKGNRICLYDLARARFIEPAVALEASGASFNSASTDLSGRLLFVGGESGLAQVWQLGPEREAQIFMELTGHTSEGKLGKLQGLFSDDSHWLVSWDMDSLQLWDLTTRTRTWEFKERGTRIGIRPGFTSDTKWLIVSRYGQLLLLDLQNRDPDPVPIELPGFRYPSIGVGISGDSRWLAAADFPFEAPRGRVATPVVRIFDLWASNPAASAVELPRLKTGATQIAISWDSQWLATTSEDGVRLWPLGVANLLRIVDEIVGRDLTEQERVLYQVD